MRRLAAAIFAWVVFSSMSYGLTFLVANGSSSVSVDIPILGPTGEPNASITVTNLDLICSLNGAHPSSTKIDLTALDNEYAAYSSGKAYHRGNGVYRICLPDANMSDGVHSVLCYRVFDASTTNTFDEAIFYVQLSAPVDANTVDGAEPWDSSTSTVSLSSATKDDIVSRADVNAVNLLAMATSAASAAGYAEDANLAATAAQTAAETHDTAAEMRVFLFGEDVEGATEPNQTTANSTIATNLDAAVSTRATPAQVTTALETTIEPNLTLAMGYASAAATDANGARVDTEDLQAQIGTAGAGLTGIPGAQTILVTTVASATDTSTFVLTAGLSTDNKYKGCVIYVKDVSGDNQWEPAIVASYVGSTKTITLKRALSFTPAGADPVWIQQLYKTSGVSSPVD